MGNWSGWSAVGFQGKITGTPAPISLWGFDWEVLARGCNCPLEVGTFIYNGCRMYGWNPVIFDNGQININGSPGAAINSNQQIHCFAKDNNNELLHMWPENTCNIWTWENLGGSVSGTPSPVCAPTGDTIYVFVLQPNNQISYLTYNSTAKLNWQSLTGSYNGSPAAWMSSSGRIDCFAPDTKNNLNHFWFENSKWNYEVVDTKQTVFGDPAVTSYSDGRLDVFIRDYQNQNQLLHTWYDNYEWSNNWENLGGSINGSPGAMANPTSKNFMCCAVDSNNNLLNNWYYNK